MIMEIENKQEKAQETHKKPHDWLIPYQFKAGNNANPGGRPKGSKSLKTYAREYLESLPEEEKIAYLNTLDRELVWKMAEGNPDNKTDLKANVNFSEFVKDLENGQPSQEVIGQAVAIEIPIQNPGQEEKPSDIQPQPSPAALPAAQVVEKYNPEV